MLQMCWFVIKIYQEGSKLNERFYKYIDDLIVNVGIQKSQNALNEFKKNRNVKHVLYVIGFTWEN